MPIRGSHHKPRWIAGAHNPAHKGELRDYVQEHYGNDGFTKAGNIRRPILRELSHHSDPHVRGMALFDLNANQR